MGNSLNPKKILFVGFGTDKHLGFFYELEGNDMADVCYVDNKFKKGFLGKLNFKMYSPKYSSYIPNFIKYRFCNTGDLNLNDYECVLFMNGSLVHTHTMDFAKRCKKKGLSVVLFLIDSMNSESRNLIRCKDQILSDLWDEIITFDERDAERYGYTFIGYPYYSFLKMDSSENVEYDAYFVGGMKGGREQQIEDLYRASTQHHLNVCFDLYTYSRKDINMLDGINYFDKWIPYSDVLSKVSNCNCIFEIIQNNQVGPSYRYFEAICYNKKLLTNNPNIINCPLYNDKWMKVITDFNEIDWDWVKSRDVVDYNYNNEFSPVKLLDYLKGRYNKSLL